MTIELKLRDTVISVDIYKLISGEAELFIHHDYADNYCNIVESKDKSKRRDIRDEAFLIEANREAIKIIKSYELESRKG
jgi:hypothetical protein